MLSVLFCALGIQIAAAEETPETVATEAAESAEAVAENILQNHIDSAKKSLLEKNFDATLTALDAAYDYAPTAKTILKAKDLAQIWYLRGMVAHLQSEDPLDDWRQALVLYPDTKWDEALSTDESAQDAFWALKAEVQSRKIVSLQVPEQYGQALLYVDGYERAPADFAYQGMHLAQIQCPQGEIFGKWSKFEKTHKWLKMCPYKFDVTDMPEAEEEDEWAMFGGSMGGDDAPSVNMDNQMVAPPLWERLHKPTLYGAGGAAVVSAGLYMVALGNNKKFSDLNNTDIKTIDDLKSLQSTTNTIAITSASLGVVSGVLYVYSLSKAKID